VPTDQAGPEGQEVPLSAGGLEHLGGADAHAVEDHRQLVHQCDVHIALRVLDDLGRLGDADGAGAEDAGRHDALVEGRHTLQGLGSIAGDDFDNALERVLLIARVDALGGVSQPEIPAGDQARFALEHRGAAVLSDPGIYGGLVDDHIARFEHAADGMRSPFDHAQIRLALRGDRGGYGDDVEGRGREVGRVASEVDIAGRERIGEGLSGAVLALPELLHPPGAHIEPDRSGLHATQSYRQREAHIAQADDGGFLRQLHHLLSRVCAAEHCSISLGGTTGA